VSAPTDVPPGVAAAALEAKLTKALNEQFVEEAVRHGVESKLVVDVSNASTTLKNLVRLLDHPAVLIDEVDFPFTDGVAKLEYTEVVRRDPGKAPITVLDARTTVLAGIFLFLKNNNGFAVHSVYVTGISQIAMRALSSHTRFINNVSYLRARQRPRLGFSRAQIERHFAAHIQAYIEVMGGDSDALIEQLEAMYNGYAFHPGDAETLFNPWSVLSFFRTGELKAHWPAATRHKWLIPHLSWSLVESLIENGTAIVTPGDLTAAIDFSSAQGLSDEAQTVLFVHTGDLTIARSATLAQPPPAGRWVVRIPNGEVRDTLLPQLVKEMCGLGEKFWTREIASKIAGGEIEWLMSKVSELRHEPHPVSSRDDAVRAHEPALSTVIARLVSAHAAFRGELRLRGTVLNEASRLGDRSDKRLDVAWTVRSADAPANESKDTTYVLELKVVDNAATERAAAASVQEATTEVQEYARRLRRTRSRGAQSVWVVVFNRSNELLVVRRVATEGDQAA